MPAPPTTGPTLTRRAARAAALAALVVAALGCSSDDDADTSGDAAPTSIADPAVDAGDAGDAEDPTAGGGEDTAGGGTEATGASEAGSATSDDGTDDADDADDADDGAAADDDPAADGSSTSVDPAVTEPTGVPGLDADLEVCRAWSRYAGSFQVVAVASSFASPDEAARLEVLASVTVTDAYDTMLEAWPTELADERDVVAEDFLGPFARRAEVAREVLVDAGADDDQLDALAAVWLDALAGRDPAAPTLDVAVPDDADEVVAAATSALRERLVPVSTDPALVTDAQVPATEAFLAERCPDEGVLAGGEVTG